MQSVELKDLFLNDEVVDNTNLSLELETAQEMLAKGFDAEGALMVYSIIIFPLKDLLLRHFQSGQFHFLPRIVYILDQLYKDQLSKELNDLSSVIVGSYIKSEDGKKFCRNCDEACLNNSRDWLIDQLHRYLLMLREKIMDIKDNWEAALFDQAQIGMRASHLHDEILKQDKLFSHDHGELTYSQAYKNLLDNELTQSKHYRTSQGKLDLIEAAQVVSLEKLIELSKKIGIYDLLPYIILIALRNDYIKISNQAFTLLMEVIESEDSFDNKLILEKTRSLLNHDCSPSEYEDQVVLPLISTNKIIIE